MKNLTELSKNKITIISGHFGTGKTNIAVNLALALAEAGKTVRIADLDIVNPYFRSADNAQMLAEKGVRALVPQFANTNVDIPGLPPDYNLLFCGQGFSVADVGGDSDGAAVLGLSHDMYVEAGYDMYFVYNKYRPLISQPESAAAMLRDIERVSGLRFCGIINNSNLGAETTKETVLASAENAKKLSELTGLPLVMTTALETLNVPDTVGIRDITKKLFDTEDLEP